MKISTNALVLLLAASRGTLENELFMGTKGSDLRVLGQAGLIIRTVVREGTTYGLTHKGRNLVAALQAVASTVAGTASNDVTVYITVDWPSMLIDGVDMQSNVVPQHIPQRSLALAALAGMANMSHGHFEVEADAPQGLKLSDVEENTARVNGGTFFVVAEAGVAIERQSGEENRGADIKSVSLTLTKIDPLVHACEQEATDVATDRAKANVGSRHVVLKAVAMHEVTVPTKSTRL